MKTLYRRWRPKSDRVSVAGLADDLSESVDQAEKKLQQELRAGLSSFMHVEFTVAAHSGAGKVIDSAEVDEIADYFDLLEQPRRLVVLGDPGAGKTVAATYLVRGLIELRRAALTDTRRAAEPVPVRLNTAGWDGGQDFTSWLVNRLSMDYRLPSNVGKEMVKRGLILPVLDGLDEMDDDATAGKRARALLNRLNQREWQDRPVVVLCRSTEFEHLKRQEGDNGLHGATEVTLTPLSTDQVKGYLADYQNRIGATDPAWDRIITHLCTQPESPLAVALKNPWMLGLTATTLRHTPQTVIALLDDDLDSDAVRELLFAAQIPGAIAGTDDAEAFRDYTNDNVEKWLRTLARCLQRRRDAGRNGTAIRLDEIWELAGLQQLRVFHTAAAMLLVLGPITVIMQAFMSEQAPGAGACRGGVIACTFLVGVGVARRKFPRARRLAWKVPNRSRWRRAVAFGLAGGLAMGLTIELAFGVILGGGVTTGAVLGLVAGPVGALVCGLAYGLETNAEDQLALGADERRLIRDDLQTALFSGVLGGPMCGVMLGLLIGLVDGTPAGLTVASITGPVAALAIALAVGNAAGRFFAAALIFKRTTYFPSRPDAFLNWARRGGLLRVNGTAYQFRHQTYQQWLLQPRPDAADHLRPTSSVSS